MTDETTTARSVTDRLAEALWHSIWPDNPWRDPRPGSGQWQRDVIAQAERMLMFAPSVGLKIEVSDD
jgi:hypothetical protein